eukprot:1340372-Amorphochlora_amoeboformis.AAC.1
MYVCGIFESPRDPPKRFEKKRVTVDLKTESLICFSIQMTVHEQNPSQFSDLCTSGCLVDDFRVAVNRDATGV